MINECAKNINRLFSESGRRSGIVLTGSGSLLDLIDMKKMNLVFPVCILILFCSITSIYCKGKTKTPSATPSSDCGMYDYVEVFGAPGDVMSERKRVCLGKDVVKEVSCATNSDCVMGYRCAFICYNPKYESWYQNYIVPCYPSPPDPRVPQKSHSCACQENVCKVVVGD